MITDKYLDKGGRNIKKVQLLYIDGDSKLCDGCDESKKCASVKTIAGDVMCICQDCLVEIVKSFN